MENKQITVTSPLLPDREEFNKFLQEIWETKWITNNGCFHQELERALCKYLEVPYVSLFTNGTLPLITALQALRITAHKAAVTASICAEMGVMVSGSSGLRKSARPSTSEP